MEKIQKLNLKNKIIKGTSRDYIEYKLLKYCLKKITNFGNM